MCVRSSSSGLQDSMRVGAQPCASSPRVLCAVVLGSESDSLRLKRWGINEARTHVNATASASQETAPKGSRQRSRHVGWWQWSNGTAGRWQAQCFRGGSRPGSRDSLLLTRSFTRPSMLAGVMALTASFGAPRVGGPGSGCTQHAPHAAQRTDGIREFAADRDGGGPLRGFRGGRRLPADADVEAALLHAESREALLNGLAKVAGGAPPRRAEPDRGRLERRLRLCRLFPQRRQLLCALAPGCQCSLNRKPASVLSWPR